MARKSSHSSSGTDTKSTKENPTQLLYVSAFLGGQRGSYTEAEAAVDELFRLKEEVCPPPGTADLKIQLIFDIPGPMVPVDYEGVRTGRFSGAKQMLVVQVAVPEGLTGSEIRRYLREALGEMVELAKAYVKRRKLPLSTEALERAVGELIARLRA